MITNNDDIIDSRDIIERIGELEQLAIDDDGNFDPDGLLDVDDNTEWRTLKELADQAEPYAKDWTYGVTLVRDSYFTEYAQELAEEVSVFPRGEAIHWPFTCIDWEQAARELQFDYTAVDFDGVTYWVR